MSLELRLAVVVAIVAGAALLGVVWRVTSGRSRRIRDGKQVDLAELGVL